MPRVLKCPRCGTVNTIDDGDPPACSHCHFGTGNAGPPAGSAGAKFKRAPPTGPPPPPPPPPTPLALFVSIAMLALGATMLLAAHLVPWSHIELARSGPGLEQDLGLWRATGEGTHPADGPVSYGYWSGPSGDVSGIWLLRLAGPVAVVALLLGAAACTTAAMRLGRWSGPASWSAVAASALAAILFALGASLQQDGIESAVAGSEGYVQLAFVWGPGFYVAVAAAAVLAVGATFGPMRLEEETPDQSGMEWVPA